MCMRLLNISTSFPAAASSSMTDSLRWSGKPASRSFFVCHEERDSSCTWRRICKPFPIPYLFSWGGRHLVSAANRSLGSTSRWANLEAVPSSSPLHPAMMKSVQAAQCQFLVAKYQGFRDGEEQTRKTVRWKQRRKQDGRISCSHQRYPQRGSYLYDLRSIWSHHLLCDHHHGVIHCFLSC